METKLTYLEPSLEKQLKGHKNGITALYFNPNDQQIASSSLDNSVLLWDLRGTMRSYRFQGHDEAVMDVTFSPSGKYMASASRDKTVRLWVPSVTGSTGTFKAHLQTVRSVQFNYDGTKIITASDDKIVKLWSTDKHKFITSYVGHTNWVRCAQISCDGSVIASCSDDKSTKLWNMDAGDCIHTYKDQKGHGLCLAWHPSGCYIAVGTSHGNVKLYDVRTHSLVQYYSIHNDAVTRIAFHPSGSYIITASKDGKMKILDLLEGHPIFTLSGHTGAVNAVHFSASGDSFASAGDDKLVFIWKTNFTELASDKKENIGQNISVIHKTNSHASKFASVARGTRMQGSRVWYLCYHSTTLPVATFVELDDVHESTQSSVRSTDFIEEHPNANSTLIEPVLNSETNTHITETSVLNSVGGTMPRFSSDNPKVATSSITHDVGHMSHIPLTPPSQATVTVPYIMNKPMLKTCGSADDLFGMIKLRDNDVCYTSGIIEWVGRKRSYPLNSGFKVMNTEKSYKLDQTPLKKIRKLNKNFSAHIDHFKECDCADILPTVNAIVDHLNALHEAVDLMDLRLNMLEEVTSKRVINP